MVEINEEKERFVVDNDSKADWAMLKIAEAEAEIRRWKQYYAEQLEQVVSENEYTIAYMRQLLKAYFAEKPHRKTATQEIYNLPSGKLVQKQSKPVFARDDDAILAWAKDNSAELVRTKEEVAWAALKDRIIMQEQLMEDGTTKIAPVDQVTGLFVDGIEISMGEPEFTVSIKKGE